MACDEPDPMPGDTTPPSVFIDPLSVIEGNGEKSIFASIRLSKASDEVVTIFLETEDVSAEAGVDYVALSQSLDFAVGSVQENVRLDILGDEESELDEEFLLKITNANGATISNSAYSVIIEDDDIGSGNVVIPSTGYSTPDNYEGLNLCWADEFDGDALNEAFWTYEIGNGDWGWGNNELEYYRRENTSLIDGHLVIEAREEPFGGFNYTSSRLITKDKFEFTHGRVDIRAVLPEGQGIWPALWMLGENISEVSWPRCGEIDIMELLGHEPNKVHGTVHFAQPNGNHQFKGSSITAPAGKKYTDEFYVYSIIWVEDKIEFFVNDQLYYTITPAVIGSQNPYPFNDPFFFIFNVAVGGNWPGSPDATTLFPQHMIVDYIRVFQEK